MLPREGETDSREDGGPPVIQLLSILVIVIISLSFTCGTTTNYTLKISD